MYPVSRCLSASHGPHTTKENEGTETFGDVLPEEGSAKVGKVGKESGFGCGVFAEVLLAEDEARVPRLFLDLILGKLFVVAVWPVEALNALEMQA